MNVGFFVVLVLTFIINLAVAETVLTFFPQLPFPGIPKPYWIMTESILVMLVLLGLSFTPVGDALHRWSLGFKKPLPQDLSRLQKILAPVFQAAGKNPADFRIYIADEDYMNAFAHGRNEIAVTPPLLALPDHEIQGILAHEVGHLHYNDPVRLRIIYTLNLVTVISFRIINIVLMLLKPFTVLPFIGFVIVGFSWFVFVFSLMIQFLSILPEKIGLIVNRAVEYRADNYAAEIGYKQHLIDGLQNFGADAPGMWQRLKAYLSSTHPATSDRIARLQNA